MSSEANEAAAKPGLQERPEAGDPFAHGPVPRRVGLLFVHGIGEQARFEHLHGAATRLAQLLKNHPHRDASVSVVDRTDYWSVPPGEPQISPPAHAPMTVHYRSQAADVAIDFECHEVWWADLGKRRGLVEAFGFWAWGLGQWAAPIYATRDASKLDDTPSTSARPQVHLPVSVGREPRAQIATRLSIAWAGVAASMIILTLSFVLRLLSFLTGAKASVDLIIDYLGDVEVYQQRGRPGEGEPSDPGMPKRVAIRRRMVTEMVAMGARGYESWSILAHSLGSVVAFNGLGEIGHALPNYCQEALWDALPDDLKRDFDCPKRDDPENMMPARPAWLSNQDCVNKTLLFGNLTNVVTYGSPLGTFAAIWPRIVAFEKGVGHRGVFAKTKWLNIVSGTDPVSGLLDRYRVWVRGDEKADLPEAFDLRRPTYASFGLSHIAYFISATRDRLIARTGGDWGVLNAASRYAKFYDDVMAQITRPAGPARSPETPFADAFVHDGQRLRCSAWVTTGLFLVCFAIAGAVCWAFGWTPPSGFSFGYAPAAYSFAAFVSAMFGWGLALLSSVMIAVYALGLFRKGKETKADIKPIDYDIWLMKKAQPLDQAKIDQKLEERRAGRRSLWINRLLGLGSVIAIGCASAFVWDAGLFGLMEFSPTPDWLNWLRAVLVPIVLIGLFWAACAIQAYVSAYDVKRRDRLDDAARQPRAPAEGERDD